MEQPSPAAPAAAPRVSPAVATYIALVAVAAAVLVAATANTFPAGHRVDLLIFLAAAVTSERWAVSSSLEGSMSLSLTVGFAAAILFGPAFAGVVAIGGDTVDIHGGRVYVNGTQLNEPYVFENQTTDMPDKGSKTWKLAAGQLFAGTDNSGVHLSTDSGATWTSFSAGMPNDTRVWSLAGTGSSIFAGTNSGVWRVGCGN